MQRLMLHSIMRIRFFPYLFFFDFVANQIHDTYYPIQYISRTCSLSYVIIDCKSTLACELVLNIFYKAFQLLFSLIPMSNSPKVLCAYPSSKFY